MSLIFKTIKEIKSKINEKINCKVFDYRIDFADKKLDEIINFQKIEFIMVYPENITLKQTLSHTNLRSIQYSINLDYFLSYQATNENLFEFSKKVEELLSIINDVYSYDFYSDGDISCNIDEVFITGILVRHAKIRVNYLGKIYGNKVFCELGGE